MARDITKRLMIPEGYTPVIDFMESQRRAIKKIKDFFQQELAYGLNLRRVSAPLFVDPGKRSERQSERRGKDSILYFERYGRKNS